MRSLGGFVTRQLASLMAVAGLLLGTLPASAATVDEQWPIPDTPQDGYYSLLVSDNSNSLAGKFSLLRASTPEENFLCADLDSGDCATAPDYGYTAVLPACEDDGQLDCIEAVIAARDGAEISRGEFTGYTIPNHPNLYRANNALQVPRGETPSTWRMTGASHSGGDLYAVSVAIEGGGRRPSPAWASGIRLQISPVQYFARAPIPAGSNGIQAYGNCVQQVNPTTGIRTIGCGSGAEELGKYNCVFKTGDSGCLLRQPFPADTRFQLRVRLSQQPNGWLHGRMDAPAVSITALATKGWLLDVTANPVAVPIFYAGGFFEALPKSIQDYYNDCIAKKECNFGTRQYRPFETPLPVNQRNAMDELDPAGKRTMTTMTQWRDYARDTSVAEPSTWTARTLDFNGSSACLKPDSSGVKGIVTTNATAYSDGPPSFVDGRLSYTVMAPHYRPDGTSLFLGRYNLVLRSDVARCLYGFSKAPIEASISVVNAEGTNVVATTAVAERNGWLTLSANGFTFSQPKIVVELTQQAVQEPSKDEPKPIVTPIVIKKSTIVCIKGKTKKKVTAVKPLCPKGWKRT